METLIIKHGYFEQGDTLSPPGFVISFRMTTVLLCFSVPSFEESERIGLLQLFKVTSPPVSQKAFKAVTNEDGKWFRPHRFNPSPSLNPTSQVKPASCNPLYRTMWLAFSWNSTSNRDLPIVSLQASTTDWWECQTGSQWTSRATDAKAGLTPNSSAFM